jgi:hypothetical protein
MSVEEFLPSPCVLAVEQRGVGENIVDFLPVPSPRAHTCLALSAASTVDIPKLRSSRIRCALSML